MASYTLTSESYAIPLLHAAAHPSSDVAGLLVGRTTRSGVEVTTALPVLHRYASLSPTLELGIDMARAWADKQGMSVVGYYEAREGKGRVGEAVLASLREDNPAALGLVLDNDKLRTTEPVYSTNPAGANVTWPSESVRSGALELVRKAGVQVDLKDLDDHLDDARVDWIGNEAVRAAVAKLA